MDNFTKRIESLSHKRKEIDYCLANLCDEILSPECVTYLALSHANSNEVTICLSLVADDIIEAIKAGRLKRWDFDPFDMFHRGQSRTIRSNHVDLSKWCFTEKCKVLCLVADAFRSRCEFEINDFQSKFKKACDYSSVIELKEEALEKGIFEEINGKIRHNCSIPYSKKVFQEMDMAIQRVP